MAVDVLAVVRILNVGFHEIGWEIAAIFDAGDNNDEQLKRFRREVQLLASFKGNSKVVRIVDHHLDHDPSDPSSRRRPCLRLVLLLVSITMNTFRFSYRGLSPHKFTPMPGVHKSLVRMADSHRTV